MASTTMTNPLGVPTTIDSTVLSTSIVDYQKRLVDNVSILGTAYVGKQHKKNNGCEFGGRLTANTEPSISNLDIATAVGFDRACVETMGNPRKG